MTLKIASVDPLKVPPSPLNTVKPNWIIAIEIGYVHHDPRKLDITRIYRGQVPLATVLQDVAGSGSLLKSPSTYGTNRLSIHAFNQLTYFVVRINDDLPWEFSENLEPFSLSKKNHLYMHYGEAMKVDKTGTIVPQDETVQGSKTAYFICDVEAIKKESPANIFAHGFNLHLDWLVDRNNNSIQRIPFVLDPEIRDPDGSEH